ncbi:MAG: glycosyltransferase family 2 protein [Patescibacteria group bacterium]
MPIDRLAIILVNYRDYADRYLADCWASLQAQTWAGQWQAVIVDNASTPETQATIARLAPEAVVITNQTNDGFAKGNNDGLAWAWEHDYRFALMLNLDTELAPDCLEQLITAANQAPTDWGAVQARLMLHPQVRQVNSLGNSLHYLGFGYSQGAGPAAPSLTKAVVPIRGYGSGAALLVRREIIEPLGGFDEVFWMYHDDLELGWRMWLTGHPAYLAPAAVVYHKYQFAKSIKQYYWMERNRFIWFWTAYRWPTTLLLLPMALVMEISLWLFAVKKGFWRENALAYGWMINPRHWRYLHQRRGRLRRLRTIPDRVAIQSLTSVIEFQEVDNWLLRCVGNPLMTLYWRVVRMLIFW